MRISEWQHMAWMLAEDKGFHEGRKGQDRDDTLVRLCLIHTEISEAAQEVKRHWHGELTPEHKAIFAEELADTMIRIFDLGGCVGVDLEEAITLKMKKNQQRSRLYNTPYEEAKP